MLWDNKSEIYKLMEDEKLRELKNQLSINGYCFESFLYRNGLTNNYRSIKRRFLNNKNFDLKSLEREFKDFLVTAKKKLIKK